MEFATSVNIRVTRGNKDLISPHAPSPPLVSPVPPGALAGVVALERRMKQRQLLVFTPFALRHSYWLGILFNGEASCWELQDQACLHV